MTGHRTRLRMQQTHRHPPTPSRRFLQSTSTLIQQLLPFCGPRHKTNHSPHLKVQNDLRGRKQPPTLSPAYARSLVTPTTQDTKKQPTSDGECNTRYTTTNRDKNGAKTNRQGTTETKKYSCALVQPTIHGRCSETTGNRTKPLQTPGNRSRSCPGTRLTIRPLNNSVGLPYPSNSIDAETQKECTACA